MIVKLKNNITNEEFSNFKNKMESLGLEIKDASGETFKVVGLIGDTAKLTESDLYAIPGVLEVTRIQTPYKKASRVFHPEDTIIEVKGVKFGGGNFTVIAGPCSVENHDQIVSIAKDVKASGAKMLRGGAFKPRTSPYSFQGLGEEGCKILKEAGDKYGLPVVTECVAAEYIPAM